MALIRQIATQNLLRVARTRTCRALSTSTGTAANTKTSSTTPPIHDDNPSSSSSSSSPHHRIHLLFGANTDVGKSIISTGLVHAAAAAASSSSSSSQSQQQQHASVNYIKPLQCGGSDESFVLRHRKNDNDGTKSDLNVNCQTLFTWETPASPHLASRWENMPVSDSEVLSSLRKSLQRIEVDTGDTDGDSIRNVTIIESAGGVLSPSSSSPLNNTTDIAGSSSSSSFWGWSTQADLYSSLNIPVVFVGDGKLGGISVTLASLEALWSRGYQVDAIVFIEGADDGDNGESIQFGKGNTEALREYMTMQNNGQQHCLVDNDSIICLPSLPPMPIPLDEWYEDNREEFRRLDCLLSKRWMARHDDNI